MPADHLEAGVAEAGWRRPRPLGSGKSSQEDEELVHALGMRMCET